MRKKEKAFIGTRDSQKNETTNQKAPEKVSFNREVHFTRQ
jgi:hypothetical protein